MFAVRIVIGAAIILGALTYHHFQNGDPALSLVVVAIMIVTTFLVIYFKPLQFVARVVTPIVNSVRRDEEE